MKSLLLFLCFLGSLKGYSCTCVSSKKTTINDAYNSASSIMVAVAIRCDTVEIRDTDYTISEPSRSFYSVYKERRLVYTIQVQQYFKLDKRNAFKNSYVVTSSGKDACSAVMRLGEKYILYVNRKEKLGIDEAKKNPFLYTDACHRNRIYNEEEASALKRLSRLKIWKRRPHGTAKFPSSRGSFSVRNPNQLGGSIELNSEESGITRIIKKLFTV